MTMQAYASDQKIIIAASPICHHSQHISKNKVDFLVNYSLRILNYQDTFRFIVCSRREDFRHFISAIQFRCTLYFDIITKQILTWKLSERRGGRDQYIDGLADVVEMLKGREEPTILHTDRARFMPQCHTMI